MTRRIEQQIENALRGQSRGVVIRPDGWRAQNDVPSRWTRAGHLYRGITEVEYQAHKRNGYIQSTGAYSHSSEGTNFSELAEDAEGYVNYGRDDPRTTGRPNYVIEIRKTPLLVRWAADGYYKTLERIPWSLVTRVWKMSASDGAIVAERISR